MLNLRDQADSLFVMEVGFLLATFGPRHHFGYACLALFVVIGGIRLAPFARHHDAAPRLRYLNDSPIVLAFCAQVGFEMHKN